VIECTIHTVVGLLVVTALVIIALGASIWLGAITDLHLRNNSGSLAIFIAMGAGGGRSQSVLSFGRV
jgi:hypothetical protein